MEVSMALFSGFTSISTVPEGNIPNASFVGAKTVKGPALFSVSTRPAAFTAATNVVWSFEFMAFSTIFLEGYIAAPPTSTVFSFDILPCPNELFNDKMAASTRPANLICFIIDLFLKKLLRLFIEKGMAL